MRKAHRGKLLDSRRLVLVLSFFIAVIVWGFISIFVNPNQIITIKDVPITLPNSDNTQNNLQIVDGAEAKVNVLVDGKRYIVNSLNSDSIVITADTSDITKPGTYSVKLKAKQKETDDNYKINGILPAVAKLRFDFVETRTYKLNVAAPEITTKENFIKGEPTSSQENISITGPKSDLDRIDKVVLSTVKKAEINQSLITDDVTVFMYDSKGNKLELNTLSYSVSGAKLSIPVLIQKTLNLTFDYRNVPADFPINELTYKMSASTIRVYAATEAASDIKDIKLGTIDFRSIGIGTKVPLDVVLPTGFMDKDNIKKVDIEFMKNDLATKTFNVKNISFSNKPNDYKISLESKSISNVKIIGKQSIISKLSAQDIVADIDLLNDLQITQKGKTTVPVRISVPGKGLVWAQGEYTAVINAN